MNATQLVWVSQGSFKTTYRLIEPKGKSSQLVVLGVGGPSFSFFLFYQSDYTFVFSFFLLKRFNLTDNNMNETEFLKDQLIKLSLEVFECKKDIHNLKENFNRLVEVTETIIKNNI